MTPVSLLIYLGLTAAGAFLFIFVLGYKYFLNLAGMNRQVVFMGTLAMSLSLALFLLVVFLFPAKKISAFFPALTAAREKSIQYWQEQKNTPFPAPSRKTTADLTHVPEEPAALLASGLPVVAAVLEGVILALLFVLIILSRERGEQKQTEDRRRHIFEDKSILDTLNRGGSKSTFLSKV